MSIEVQNWDTPGANWDAGFQWDVNLPPGAGDVTPYLKLITSEHAQRAKFIAMMTAFLQPLADNIAVIQSIPQLFDIDQAVGDQLDIVGKWIGRSRYLSVPLEGVYFSFGIEGVGFNQGVWKGPFDPDNGLIALDDESYRIYLRATIAANQWDGTLTNTYEVYAIIFGPEGFRVLIIDNCDMTMYFGLIGGEPNAVTIALLTGGYLSLKPAGVRILGYMLPTAPNTPLFGFGVDNDSIGGFGHGSWCKLITTP